MSASNPAISPHILNKLLSFAAASVDGSSAADGSSAVDTSAVDLIHVLSLWWYHVKIIDGPPTILFSMVPARSLFSSSKSANPLKLG